MPMSSIDHAIHGSSLIYEVNEILNLLGHGYLKLGAAPILGSICLPLKLIKVSNVLNHHNPITSQS